MKKTLYSFTLFLLVTSAGSLFAKPAEAPKKQAPLNKGFFYFKVGGSTGVSESEPALSQGVGYRTKLFDYISGAIDLNILQSCERVFPRYRSAEVYLPKISYQYYFRPYARQSFFIGAGYGIAMLFPKCFVNTHDKYYPYSLTLIQPAFIGTSYALCAGYDMNVRGKYLSTIILEANIPGTCLDDKDQPLASYKHYSTLNISYCIGY